MNKKKLLLALPVLASVTALAGCVDTTPDPINFRVKWLTPAGSPTLAFYNEAGNKNWTTTSNPAGEFPTAFKANQHDALVFDGIAGLNLINKNKGTSDYQLYDFINEGTFYLVSLAHDDVKPLETVIDQGTEGGDAVNPDEGDKTSQSGGTQTEGNDGETSSQGTSETKTEGEPSKDTSSQGEEGEQVPAVEPSVDTSGEEKANEEVVTPAEEPATTVQNKLLKDNAVPSVNDGHTATVTGFVEHGTGSRAFRALADKKGWTKNIKCEWKDGIKDVMNCILKCENPSDYYIVAEPMLTLIKGQLKAQNEKNSEQPKKEIKFEMSLTTEWTKTFGESQKFPAAALFVNKTSMKDHPEEMKKFLDNFKANREAVAKGDEKLFKSLNEFKEKSNNSKAFELTFGFPAPQVIEKIQKGNKNVLKYLEKSYDDNKKVANDFNNNLLGKEANAFGDDLFYKAK